MTSFSRARSNGWVAVPSVQPSRSIGSPKWKKLILIPPWRCSALVDVGRDKRIEVREVGQVPAHPALAMVDEYLGRSRAVHVGGKRAAIQLGLSGQRCDELAAAFCNGSGKGNARSDRR